MNILSHMLLSASPMIVVAGSIFMLLCCSSNVGVLGSTGDGIENMDIHFSGEFVTISLLFPILIGLLILLVWTLAHRTRRRKSFTVQTKKLVLRDQNFRCSICRMNAGIGDYDHKDGNRGNNKVSNCQVLCPTCHAKKSRGLLTRDIQNKSKNIVMEAMAVGLILIMILYSYSA